MTLNQRFYYVIKRFERITDYKGPYLTFEDIDFDLIEHSDVSIHPSDEDDCACLLYTSGTTGSPKEVMTSHRSMINNTMLQLLQGAAVSMRSTRLGTDWTVNKANQFTYLTILSCIWIISWSCNCVVCWNYHLHI